MTATAVARKNGVDTKSPGSRSKARTLATRTKATSEIAKKGRPKKKNASAKVKRSYDEGSEADDDEDADDEGNDAYVEDGSGDSDVLRSLDSDALDDDSDFETSRKRKKMLTPAKRKRGSTGTGTSPSKTRANASPNKLSPRKKRCVDEDGEDGGDDGEDGQEVVGIIVQAPKTGKVPPGQISQNTFNFLKQLQDPECNDRIWFKLHEPVFRQAEKEWKDFIDEFTPLLMEADTQIPLLPPNDVVHRIYRDVRFSNDKTPYKTNFSASFSRSGRKGLFAHYHVSIRPGGDSIFAAGAWCPGKDELQTIRNHINRNARPLRQLISSPDFVSLFGPAKPHPKGNRQNIFGHDDELKVAPKGVDKKHKDIDLLKCRSFAVVHKFTDKEVLDPNFKHELKRLVEIVRPFVHKLNDMMTLETLSGEEDGDEDEGGEGGGDEN